MYMLALLNGKHLKNAISLNLIIDRPVCNYKATRNYFLNKAAILTFVCCNCRGTYTMRYRGDREGIIIVYVQSGCTIKDDIYMFSHNRSLHID